ncbi:pentapeptide repeat-containing protein [Stackebrandtia soli]|uniref:pentapeptide repeat-containing protein n=1 Tax=Stackebrandtia soli TaxID=1892856 RepID=UPI0039EA11A7
MDDKARFEVAKIVLAIVGGLGGVVFLTIGYRKQRDGEAAERRNDAAEQRLDAADAREQSKHFHERFSGAAEQLGSNAARVRLAGAYSMAALADDWDAGRQTCINVLCGYVRAPYQPPGELDDTADEQDLQQHRAATEEREIRRAILDTIGERLRAEPVKHKTWHGHRFDLNGAVIDAGDLSRSKITPGTVLNLARATFSGGDVSFARAKFSGGNVSFPSAKFSGGNVSFFGATFSGGDVSFARAKFSGGIVSFPSATFSGGIVSFVDAKFSGGIVSFPGADFSGVIVSFEGATFSGRNVSFAVAKFSGGIVSFARANFSGGKLILTGVRDWSAPPKF